MVLAAKRAFPSATIFAHTSTWAVYANGCAGSGATDNLTSKNLLDFKSVKSMVNWSPEDIELSAMANVRFYRELFGWDWNDEEHVNDYNGGLMWPHGFAVEKYGYDAGMVEASNHYTIQTTDPNGMPGAGTRAYYWNQNQMDNWLRWCSVLSQGSKLPLLAYGIPLGNGSLTNQPLSWKDTFVDWLFNSPHWGDTYTWNPDNWERFKQAGFIGIWAGRGGWPATGTHWASRAVSAGDGSGCFATINGQYIDCPANTPGDNGYFFSQFRSRDLTFTPIPITFDEENFAKFSGFCTGRSEATVKTEFFGIQAKDAAGNRKDGVFSSGSKTPTATIDGATTTQALDNNTAIAQMPDYMKSNALWLFALENGKYEAIQGDLASGTRVNGGLVNDASKAQIKQVLENQVSAIGLMLEVDFSTIEGWPYWEDRPDWRIASVFPMEYELYVYDHLGHYINSVNGFLSDVDVAKYSRVDPEDGHLKLSLLLYFVPMDSKGRHIGTGVYTMRGFFKEQTKWLCQPLKPDPSSETGCTADGQQNPIPGNCPMTVGGAIDVVKDICPAYILERYRVNVSDPGSIAAGNWETNVFQNSVVVTEKFGYTRIRQ